MTDERHSELDWNAVELVVFDVDGTLYRQDILRRRMLQQLLLHAIARADLKPLRILSSYRQIRESLAVAETERFEPILVAETAREVGCAPCDVDEVVSEWIHRRPLRLLAPCRYPFLPELFRAIKRKRKIIGILSDYPAKEKMQAMELEADYIVTAHDEAVGILKPHPRGLEVLMTIAGVLPSRTVLIGDRHDRDGAAAQRAGVTPLIRSAKSIDGWRTFATFQDMLFVPLLG
ncbi:MAG: HAD family hydrolase [Nitrospira sp.]|nr:HAD family hydrolase [Nitrospira sp.]